jgi:hypothetical protein
MKLEVVLKPDLPMKGETTREAESISIENGALLRRPNAHLNPVGGWKTSGGSNITGHLNRRTRA